MSPDSLAEKAFAAYIRGFRDPEADLLGNPNEIDVACIRSGALAGVGVHEGRQTTPRSASAIVVGCASADRPILSAPWFTLSVEIELHTHRSADDDGTTRAEVLHTDREEAIEALIRDECDMMAEINKQPGPETRPVTGCHLIGVTTFDTSAEVTGDAFVKRWTLGVMFMPSDAAAA